LQILRDVVGDLLRGRLRILDDARPGERPAPERRHTDRDRHHDGDEPDLRPDGHGCVPILPRTAGRGGDRSRQQCRGGTVLQPVRPRAWCPRGPARRLHESGAMARSGRVRAMVSIALICFTGCYQWVAVKPSKLPKTAAEVVEIDTEEDEMTFWRPRATIEMGTLLISGDNLPPTAIPLDQITEARV